MTSHTVTTQAELDAALADSAVSHIGIRSEPGVRLTLSQTGSATVEAYGSATVQAGSHVAVHLYSSRCRVQGGVLIDHTALDLSDAVTWCAYHGATVESGCVVLYKAVRDDYRSAHGTLYTVGQATTCDDWIDDGECGHGLHVAPRPHLAAHYDRDATRYLQVTVSLTELRPIGGPGAAKAKASAVHVVCEVDHHGRPLDVAGGAA